MPPLVFNGHSLEALLLIGSFLLVLSVLASRISSKFGVPLLLVFLGIGMLAGTEGPGRIAFDNYPLSFAIGSICLAMIVFDGGLRTSWSSIRPVLGLGISLSFVGTLATALVTALFVRHVLGLGWIESSLLGAIVSSTDAAAVFGILRARSLSLKGQLKQLLEFEAGSNDPVAVFLTVSVLTYITPGETSLMGVLSFFFVQTTLGLGFGYYGGKAIKYIINNVGLEFEGLYSVLLLSLVVLVFALSAYAGGSGFLAVYVTGVVLGNTVLLHKSSIEKFVDGMAWIAQILVFLTLGLLVYPSHLLSVWREGLVLGVFMMFVARPLSVLVASAGSKLDRNERFFVSWVGLRGAAPIILATLPWSSGLPNAEYVFNLVFFVVLISVVSQGISIPWIANLFKVTTLIPIQPDEDPKLHRLPDGFVLIEVEIGTSSLLTGKRIVDASLPQGVLFTSINRNEVFIIPRGDTLLEQGDRITGFARESNFETLRELFGTVKRM